MYIEHQDKFCHHEVTTLVIIDIIRLTEILRVPDNTGSRLRWTVCYEQLRRVCKL